MQAIRDITGENAPWPNARALADEIGEDYGTVRKWLQRERIPERVWPAIIRKSARTAHPITADLLLAMNKERRKRAKS